MQQCVPLFQAADSMSGKKLELDVVTIGCRACKCPYIFRYQRDWQEYWGKWCLDMALIVLEMVSYGCWLLRQAVWACASSPLGYLI